jgi:hypothetical protein
MGFSWFIADRGASVMATRRNKQRAYRLDAYDGCGMCVEYTCEHGAPKSGRRERGVGWSDLED